MTKFVTIDLRDNHVATVTLDRPPYNHVNLDVLRAMADAFERLDADPACRAVVFATSGKVFCGGADLAAPDDLLGRGAGGLAQFYDAAVRLFATRKPIVAAVQGAAVGAGLGVALIADYRVAGPDARFAANFVKLGFHAGFGLSHTLPRLIGQQRASVMLLTGRRIKPEMALGWGLVDDVVPENPRDAAMSLAQELAANAPLAVEATRATLRDGLADAVRAQTRHELVEQRRLMKTTDFVEGVSAVTDRREGRFSGT